jgi:predicted ribosome quality control (RQC) complex YloA/Tae2 family protein
METPMIDENSFLFKKISELRLKLENYQNRKQFVDEKIVYLRSEISSLLQQDAHYDTIGDILMELNSMITEGTWTEKELV